MKLITLFFFNFICMLSFCQSDQLEKLTKLYKKDSIIEIYTVTNYFDTIWIPGDENEIISVDDWYNGDSTKFKSNYSFVNDTDTFFFEIQYFEQFQFENLRLINSSMTASLTRNGNQIFIKYFLSQDGKLMKETIDTYDPSTVSYMTQIIDYEYSGNYLTSKIYYDCWFLNEKKIVKKEVFTYR